MVLTPLLITALILWMVWMPGCSYSPSAASTAPDLNLESKLRKHVSVLASDIGGRSVLLYPKLLEAEKYLTDYWKSAGFEVHRDAYKLTSGEEVANLEVLIPGKDSGKSLVIGAHYDSVEQCPGANDNASGAAAVLELAVRFKNKPAAVNLRFVLFVNEEPPYFRTPQQGSAVYVKHAAARVEKIVGMLAIETIGYFSDTPGSQQYPFPFSLIYPSTGNFIGFVGNLSSGLFVRKVVRAFRKHAQLPSEGVAAPSFIPGIDWSDHASFWDAGIAAVMVTDTAPFRYPHYHEPTDTPEKLDYARFTKVVVGLEGAIGELP